MTDTIFALATPPGRGAVAVIRISGPASGRALAQIGATSLTARRASLRRLADADHREIDQALVFWFPGPASFTGEDSAELHLHGGLAVIETMTAALLHTGLRLAEPGEFTRRAFENGKLDLSQAEAVADLVDAETSAQRDQALQQLGGALSRRYEDWRQRLIHVLAMLEAAVDFPDEELPEDVAGRARPDLDALLHDLEQALSESARGTRIREGYRIALTGAPNAGKSSLFNALVERDAAIVTPIAGTTRDVIEGQLVLGGRKVLIADTAGLRETGDVIEAEGVARARAWAAAADLELRLVPVDEPPPAVPDGVWLIRTKADLRPDDGDGISIATGQGLAALRAALTAAVVAATSGAEFPAATQARHAIRLKDAHQHLDRAVHHLHEAELASEDVRLAIRALEAVAGRVDVEAVLDVIFSSFCIGK
ncbi:tRNA uridine-5-carboxymethylaminomethyl(34) synthesis GTPase MnmE [Brevundimonas aveniformis]|mgnify:CR=1 FL=1|uniref:tRNA uridine-5-carboxymethylaminomethyl(34) synthesis GTPase MnmE n=1 Tax=Brevundimonas aveniformis TaxID=370977 RepID=UPI002493A442|nr:tRNA uridine-5-carboxymethylaminomethyl(34) synthesis GTPase MnmE [Brevundimonas aveniformis]